MNEMSKAAIRRFYDIRFVNTYFKGDGIDIGCGPDPLSKFHQQFPLMTSLKAWDLQDGDAQLMRNASDSSYDFVHSSHCLEHMVDPYEAFENWIRICKPGGHIITTIPDEDMYEQGQWPSVNNTDHKTSWTMTKTASWSPVSINLFDFLCQFRNRIEVIKVEKINAGYVFDAPRIDQTNDHNPLSAKYTTGIAECAIEFIVRKLTDADKVNRGRLSTWVG